MAKAMKLPAPVVDPRKQRVRGTAAPVPGIPKATGKRAPATATSKGPSVNVTKAAGGLSKKEARKIIARVRGRLKKCFQRTGLTEKVSVDVMIRSEKVSKVRVNPSSAKAFESCVAPAIRAMTLPKTPGAMFSTIKVTVRP